MELTKSQKELLEECLESLDFDIHKDYSGRGMFGKECFGFSTRDNCAELKLAVEMADARLDNEEALELLRKMSKCGSSDSLGLDKIYYYASIQWPD